MEIIDFHNHHIRSRLQEAVVRAAPPHHPMRRVLVDAMRRAGLSETEQQAIAATNCRRLLGLGGPAQP